MFRLINPNSFPPGGYVYVDPNAGKTFGGSYGLAEQAQRVSQYRRANKFPNWAVSTCALDIDTQTCARLGNNPAFVYDTDAPVTNESLGLPSAGGACAGCGAQVTQ